MLLSVLLPFENDAFAELEGVAQVAPGSAAPRTFTEVVTDISIDYPLEWSRY